jgi:hypothetical protein
MKLVNTLAAPALAACILLSSSAPAATGHSPRWHEKFDFIRDIAPIVFHYDHGVLAGSYPPGRETTTVGFEDVSAFLGHVCLCGAGGFRISRATLDELGAGEAPLEKGDFVLVTSKDNTVSDVVAFVLGCERRNDPAKNGHFIDERIEAPKREYHYYIAYRPLERAVHVVYRKHLLIGNDMMDRLWKVETSFDADPASVGADDMELYQATMVEMVREVLLRGREELISVESIEYEGFLARLDGLKTKAL